MYYGYKKDYKSFEVFATTMSEYIYYYNNKRIQAKTKWMPPCEIQRITRI
ncbi:MAG: IS3 family transposase [Oscillospiraceae bacterium]|nr:IS3 family transposase [Oscillospiraceae bacterium]